jgi:hypothetical protein
MIRRRRPTREIPFSFDSFLDLVANVVGIIIRLILITWVGAKSYTGFVLPTTPAPPMVVDENVTLPEPEDPLAPALERQKHEMALLQTQLLEQTKAWEDVQGERKLTEQELAALTKQLGSLAEERHGVQREAAVSGRAGQGAALSLAEIQQRGKRLTDELEALRKAPSAKQTHRYRTPVSHPLQTEEIMFECYRGRVTFIDLGTMLEEVQRGFRDKGELLRTQWQVSDLTAPAGPFRMRYTVERERGMLEGGSAAPGSRDNYRFGIYGWEIEPVQQERGETAEQALAKGSAFRKVIDGVDPNQTAVTFSVYPDSFVLYRQLRDYLHDRDFTVAGRPLPDGTPIAARRDGTASRGQ